MKLFAETKDSFISSIYFLDSTGFAFKLQALFIAEAWVQVCNGAGYQFASEHEWLQYLGRRYLTGVTISATMSTWVTELLECIARDSPLRHTQKHPLVREYDGTRRLHAAVGSKVGGEHIDARCRSAKYDSIGKR